MSGWSSLLLVVVVLASGERAGAQAPGSAAPSTNLPAGPKVELRLITEAEEVDLGKAFRLTVIRTWTTDLVPEDWEDAALAPLVVRLVQSARRESAGQVVETRDFDAYAFVPDRVTVPEISFAAHPAAGGEARVARAGPLELRVRSALESARPGAPELPGGLLPAPRPWPVGEIIAVVAAMVALLGGLGWWLRRARAEAAGAEMAPDAVALRRLRALREQGLGSPDACAAGCMEVAALVRDYLAARFAVNAREMTSEELVAWVQERELLPTSESGRLAEILGDCDRGNFGRHAPTPAMMESILNGTEAFLETARSTPGPVAGRDSERSEGGAG